MSEEEDKRTTAASFKLSTLETIAADPLMKPIDHALMGVYMRFMKWPSRTAYLTNTTARTLLGGTKIAQTTISRSRARLVKYGYLKQVMTKLNGATVYEINNPRADVVAEHVCITCETLKEWDALRKADYRRKRASKMNGTSGDEGKQNETDSISISLDNSLEEIPGSRAPKEGKIQNAYAKASGGY